MTPSEQVATDAGLRRLLVAARAWGVSPSQFMGAPTPVRHEYDQTGRLVRSVTGPVWTADDRDLALALAAWEADLCPGCQHPLSETTDIANDERYDAKVAAKCHRCAALAIVQENVQDRPQASALLLSAQLRQPEG